MELLPAATAMETAYAAKAEATLFERPKAQEKTVTRLTRPLAGRQIRFTNVEQEEPIGELAAYHVTAGAEPAGTTKLAFKLGTAELQDPTIEPLETFIAGRFAPDERATLVAAPNATAAPPGPIPSGAGLPIVHLLVPDTWDALSDGLDGIALDLPALRVQPTHGGLFPLNIQVRDPLWPMREALDFTCSVKPGEAKTLWLDLRDRLLPAEKGLLISIAGAGDFNAATLAGAELRLVFKSREAARAEHELDRFTQAKDSYAMLVEEHPNSPKLNLWVRFKGDLEDLLRVNPEHALGQRYAAAATIPGAARPKFTQPAAPAGVPLWAFQQTYLLGQVQRFVDYYIDHRQSEYGDFGGGISDDVDLLNTWPGVALMGIEPEKIRLSNRRLLDAAFKNGMFMNGLPTIQADELHSYEEGINCLAQNLIVDFGNPQQLERAMATTRGVNGITGINAAGHRHIRSAYYSGTRLAEDGPWGWSKPYSYLVCQGAPTAHRIQREPARETGPARARRRPPRPPPSRGRRAQRPADRHSFLGRPGGRLRPRVLPWHIFWGAWKWTGDRKYLAPVLNGSAMMINANALDLLNLRGDWAARNPPAPPAGRRNPNSAGELRPGNRAAGFRGSLGEHFAWQTDADKSHLERLYAQQIESCATNEYIETEGSLWIDRVGVPTAELQRARLGAVALVRNGLFPGHVVSWDFAAPATGRSVAILVPNATPTGFKVIAHNLEASPVRATMTGWNIDPGIWEISQGIDSDNDDVADASIAARAQTFERSRSLEFNLPARATTVITLKLKSPGKPYWSRPDLGLAADDVTRRPDGLHVKIHSLGSVPAPATVLVLRDASGREISRAATPAIAAPNDLQPKIAEVTLALPSGASLSGATLALDPDDTLGEITRLNNSVAL
jgi:hypothetical protein